MQKFKRGVVDSENTNRMTDVEDKKETRWSSRDTKGDVGGNFNRNAKERLSIPLKANA